MISDCIKCWDTPCTCAAGYLGSKIYAYEQLKNENESLKRVVELQKTEYNEILETQLVNKIEQLKKENTGLIVNFKNVKSISESRESIINNLISENAKQKCEIEQLKSKLKVAVNFIKCISVDVTKREMILKEIES